MVSPAWSRDRIRVSSAAIALTFATVLEFVDKICIKRCSLARSSSMSPPFAPVNLLRLAPMRIRAVGSTRSTAVVTTVASCNSLQSGRGFPQLAAHIEDGFGSCFDEGLALSLRFLEDLISC
ncbi:hypothetical protein BBJ29_003065 [Phytophthora kernoviae]|uniref:Uncharacterized protein n=1 Tax=Phytophthora kernoviae TaxID=325452 RepID=A0A3F2RND7_9STRA|nr:hypothetical protein BBJ29_003065 [Phytophthora kernoviae]RLN60658.1 hypothetical protein BBP00_00005863 [Phytophthora kernoviae]